MQIKALAFGFAALMAGANAAAIGSIPSTAKVTESDCPGHISVACFYYGNSACCSWTCDATGKVIEDECTSGGP